MGGYVALRAVKRNPERIVGLILADTRSEGDPNPGKIGRATSIKKIKAGGLSEFCEGFLKSCFAPESFQKIPDRIEKIRHTILGNPPLGICGTLMALAGRTDTTGSLGSIQVPTLILVGEKDAITPREFSQKMKAGIPGSELVLIPQAGHLSNVENPETFNQSLNQFMSHFSATV